MNENDTSSSDIVCMEPYSVLAAGYDVVMDHVDYHSWAVYIQQLIDCFHPEADRILELGCGTGTLAFQLQPMGPYLYAATDGSSQMIRVARRKAQERQSAVQFAAADFMQMRVDEPVDVVLLLYDGMNYLLEDQQVGRLFNRVYEALDRDGIFIFDQSTPVNSLNNEEDFEDEGTIDGFHFVRQSFYDPDTHHHTTRFDITVEGTTYREEHVQRAYAREEVRSLINETPFSIAACYDDFTRTAATDQTERIHWVLKAS